MELVRRPLAITSAILTQDVSTQTVGSQRPGARRLNTFTRTHGNLTVFPALAVYDAVWRRYLNSRAGLTFVQTRRARGSFRNAVRRVIHRLRLRKAWSRIGQWFQDPQLKVLVYGLTHVQGQLRRNERAPNTLQTFNLHPR